MTKGRQSTTKRQEEDTAGGQVLGCDQSVAVSVRLAAQGGAAEELQRPRFGFRAEARQCGAQSAAGNEWRLFKNTSRAAAWRW